MALYPFRAKNMIVHKAITRVELYDAVYRKAGLSRSDSAALTESVLKEICDCIVRGETVKLAAFGSFMVRKKGQRPRRSPSTCVELIIDPRRVFAFNASLIMKAQVNGKRPVSPCPFT